MIMARVDLFITQKSWCNDEQKPLSEVKESNHYPGVANSFIEYFSDVSGEPPLGKVRTSS